MKIVFELENLGCVNCAAIMERKINKIKGVSEASVNFFSSKLTIEIDQEDMQNIVNQAEFIIKKIEPQVRLRKVLP